MFCLEFALAQPIKCSLHTGQPILHFGKAARSRALLYVVNSVVYYGCYTNLNHDKMEMSISTERYQFIGKGVLRDGIAIPHGAGQWTFKDGSTLTGDNVAFDGLPHGKGLSGEDEYFAGEPLNKKRKI